MIFSRLRTYCFCAAVFVLQACNHEVPSISGWSNEEEVRVDRDELVLKPKEGLLYHDGRPFTGLSVRYYADSTLAEEIAYEDGKKHGVLKRWFPLGILSQEANYRNGKLHGISKTWWENGNLRSENRFENGSAEGIQRKWYHSGKRFKEQYLVDGREQGLQRAWRENGVLYVNYEARNGRVFGLKKAGLCYEVEDEKVKYSSVE